MIFSRLSSYADTLKADMQETQYSPPDISTSIQDSPGGSSCKKFCLWGKYGKAYHPPESADTTVEFL
jgi:hypothetical protein